MALREAEDALREREREDLLRFQLGEYAALDPQPGEIDALEVQVQKLGMLPSWPRSQAGRSARCTALMMRWSPGSHG